MKTRTLLKFIFTALALTQNSALASTSEMSYEGVLTDVLGNPVTVTTPMSVRVTDGASCVVHTQSFPSVTPDTSGFFTLRLTGLDSDDFNLPGNCVGSTARYFELTVAGEVFPLIELDTVPYANVARYTQTLSGPHGATADGQVLTWNNTTKTWSAATPGAMSLPDLGTAGTYGSSSSVPVLTTDVKGRVTAVANTAISITPAAITGTIPVSQGGTGATSLTTGQVVTGGSPLQTLNCSNGEVIKYNASNQAVCGVDDSGGNPTGSAGGALSGNYPSPTLSTGAVALVNFSSMGLTPAETGRVLKWSGSSWITAPDDIGISGGVANTLPKYDSATSMIPSTIQDDGAGTINIANANAKLRFNSITVLHSPGTENTGVGLVALNPAVSGTSNTAVGSSALDVVTSGAANVAVGAHSQGSNVLGVENTSIGVASVAALTNGSYNVGVGNNTLGSTANGQSNTAVGYRAGYYISGVSNSNVFLGRSAGPTSISTISNRLYIHNNVSDTPLIGGNFSTPAVDINGSLNIDFAGGYLNYQPNGNACNAGDTLSWDNVNLRWVCGPASAGGDITSVTAGTGLSGGNTSGDATLSVVYGITANTAVEGNDSRLSDARTPAGAAGGSLTGTYPNPSIANGAISYANLNSSGGPVNDGLILKDAAGHLFGKACTANQVLNWTVASGWDCVNPSALVGVISSGTQNYLAKYNPSGNNLLNSLVYDDGNRVGIGTSSPITNLEVLRGTVTDTVWNDVSHFMAQTGGGVVIRSFVDGAAPANRKAAIQGTQFGYNNPGTPAPADLVLQMDGGNIGLGMTSPTSKFDVYSTSSLSNSYTGKFVLSPSSMGTGTSAAVLAQNDRSSDPSSNNTFGSLNKVNYSAPTVASGSIFGARNDVNVSNGGGASVGGAHNRLVRTGGSITDGYGTMSEVQTGAAMTSAYGTKSTVTGGATTGYGVATQVSGGSYNVAYGVVSSVTASGTAAYGISTTVGGASSSASGIYVNSVAGGANAYGIFIGSISGTNRYSIYQSDSTSPNYFAGNVGIDIANATEKLHVNGNVLAYGFNYISDGRLKENIQPSDFGLDFINSLRPVSYFWKERQDGSLHYGFIAQEVEEAVKLAKQKSNRTSEAENAIYQRDPASDRYSVKYGELVSPAIKAIQELYAIVTGVDERVQKLEAENASLKAYLCAKEPSAPICH